MGKTFKLYAVYAPIRVNSKQLEPRDSIKRYEPDDDGDVLIAYVAATGIVHACKRVMKETTVNEYYYGEWTCAEEANNAHLIKGWGEDFMEIVNINIKFK